VDPLVVEEALGDLPGVADLVVVVADEDLDDVGVGVVLVDAGEDRTVAKGARALDHVAPLGGG
jgi:hypothetical protein